LELLDTKKIGCAIHLNATPTIVRRYAPEVEVTGELIAF
jgi:hypothetical protein